MFKSILSFNYHNLIFLSEVSSTIGHLTSFWNIPQVVWRGNSLDLGDKSVYTTLVRTNGPLYEAGEAIVALFKKIGWQKIGLLYLEAGHYSLPNSLQNFDNNSCSENKK